MKSELAIVSVFSTVLGCLVVNLWLWTLFRAGKKVLRSSSFVIVSVVTALFTVEVLLRIFLYVSVSKTRVPEAQKKGNRLVG